MLCIVYLVSYYSLRSTKQPCLACYGMRCTPAHNDFLSKSSYITLYALLLHVQTPCTPTGLQPATFLFSPERSWLDDTSYLYLRYATLHPTHVGKTCLQHAASTSRRLYTIANRYFKSRVSEGNYDVVIVYCSETTIWDRDDTKGYLNYTH